MSYFDQLYSKLFSGGTKISAPMIVDDVLKRSNSFAAQYEDWRESDAAKDLISDILESYQSALIGVGKSPSIVLHQSLNSNGFAVSYDERYEKNAFSFLLDYLAEKAKGLGYRSVLGKQTLKEKGKEVEKKEIRYLKPKPAFVEPIEQLYGNIHIEVIYIDDEPYRLKLVANTYSDRKYTSPLGFEELVEKILVKHNI